MSKLISAGFMRLRKNRVFWLTCAAAFLLTAIMIITQYSYHAAYSVDGLELRGVVFDYVPTTGLFTAVFVGMMLGSEYSDGTVRNKLIVGHKRSAVFFSYVIVAVAGAMFIAAVCMVTTFALGALLYDSVGVSVGACLWLSLCSLLLTAGYAAAAALVFACTKNRAAAAVLCIIAALALLMGGAYLVGRLEEPKMIDNYLMINEYGVPTQVESEPNPMYVSGAARTALELAAEFLPGGQAVLISNFEVSRPERLPLMSLIFIAVCTSAGYGIFRKKDLI